MSGVETAALAVMWTYVLGFLLLTTMASRAAGTSVWLFSVGKERQTLPAALFRLAFVLGLVMPPVSKWLAESEFGIGAEPALGTAADVVGLMIMAAGAATALYAQNHMGRSWRIGAAEGHLGVIVDTGPFGVSRNPVFVGQAVLFLGSLLVFPTVLQTSVVIGLLWAIRLQVEIEERVLSKELGQPYADYRRRVRRWL